MEALRNIVIFVLFFYVVLCILLFAFQRRFIYYPSGNIEPFANYALDDFAEVKLKTEDGVEIFAWYKKPGSKTAPVILMFHGNAGNLSHRIDKLRVFADYKDYGIMAIDYRGYGRSGGSPSEQGLYQDARASLDYLKSKGISRDDTILYGESLGTGVAVKMAEERGARMLILEAPFMSAIRAGQDSFPLFPVNMLLLDRYNSIDIISKFKMPVLIFYGDQDKVINPRHSQILYEHVKSRKKVMNYEGKGHNDLDPGDMIKEIVKFNR